MVYLCAIDARHGAAVLYAEHECRRAHVVRRELCDACAGSYLRAFPDGLRCRSCDAITTVSIVPVERAKPGRAHERLRVATTAGQLTAARTAEG